MHEKRVVKALLRWFSRNRRDLPWRRTTDPYAIWVSEIMLQQTQVKTVIPYWERWMRSLPTVQALAKARPERLHKLWEGLGYYTRVRNMQKAAQTICDLYGGEFPRRHEDILELPGVGRYTAGAICSIAYNQPTPILDGNVIRVLTRLMCIRGSPKDPKINRRLWSLAEALVQVAGRELCSACRGIGNASALNQSLMELGATVCTAKRASCEACPLLAYCMARRRSCVHELPQAGSRPQPTPRRFIGFVISDGRNVLVRQRPPGVVNGGLWEFPNVEVQVEKNGVNLPPAQLLAELLLGSPVGQLDPLCSIRHSITRFRITLEMFHGSVARLGDASGAPSAICMPLTKARRLAFASAHRKVLERLPANGRLQQPAGGRAPH